jgi:hypothetical protein
MSWKALEDSNPELADFGKRRFSNGIAYLGTVDKKGSPRVHPVTPIIGLGRLFIFMEPTSPKGYDLRRGSRYALHSTVEDYEGGGGEFMVSGTGRFLEDPESRAIAVEYSIYPPAKRYILFELLVDSALGFIYQADEKIRMRWNQS